MSFFSRLLRDHPDPRDDGRGRVGTLPSAGSDAVPPVGQSADDQAVERYRYLLRTAPPETIEQAHAEAFTQLTPAQRRLLLEGLNRDLPPQERGGSDDPRPLARMATRAELRRPGTLEHAIGALGRRGSAVGVGGLLAGDFLSTLAGVVIGTAVADAIFDDGRYDEGYQAGADAADADAAGAGEAIAGDLGGGEL